MTTGPLEPTTEAAPNRNQRRWIAVIFGVFCAGVGLLYCGRIALAALVAISAVALSIGVCWAFTSGPSWMLALPVWWVIAGLFVIGNLVITWRVASKSPVEFMPHSIPRFLFYAAWQATVIGSTSAVLLIFGEPHSFKVPSAAMEDTLIVGDVFVASMNAYDNKAPQRGELVIFLWPGDGITQYIKRCVALPGDTIEIRDTILYVNGVPQANPPTVKFIDSYGHRLKTARIPTFLGQDLRDYFGPYVVPPDCYFMLGDNRDNSSDSRVWGPVRHDLLLGKAVRIISSPDPTRVGTYLSDKVFAE